MTQHAPVALKDAAVGDSRGRAIAARDSIAARNAAQADQDALNSLEAAERKVPPPNHESKSNQEFAGYSSVDRDKFKATQAAYEAALSADEAYVSLGRSLIAETDSAGAKQALARLKSLPNISPRVLKLWDLYADMIPEKASDPL